MPNIKSLKKELADLERDKRIKDIKRQIKIKKAGKKGSKKIKSTVKSVEQVMADMDNAVGQFGEL